MGDRECGGLRDDNAAGGEGAVGLSEGGAGGESAATGIGEGTTHGDEGPGWLSDWIDIPVSGRDEDATTKGVSGSGDTSVPVPVPVPVRENETNNRAKGQAEDRERTGDPPPTQRQEGRGYEGRGMPVSQGAHDGGLRGQSGSSQWEYDNPPPMQGRGGFDGHSMPWGGQIGSRLWDASQQPPAQGRGGRDYGGGVMHDDRRHWEGRTGGRGWDGGPPPPQRGGGGGGRGYGGGRWSGGRGTTVPGPDRRYEGRRNGRGWDGGAAPLPPQGRGGERGGRRGGGGIDIGSGNYAEKGNDIVVRNVFAHLKEGMEVGSNNVSAVDNVVRIGAPSRNPPPNNSRAGH